MDTVLFKIYDIEGIQIASWSAFYPEFSTRQYHQLSEREREMARNKKLPYIRHFILRPDVANDIHFPKVEIYEKADDVSKTVSYETSISASLPKLNDLFTFV